MTEYAKLVVSVDSTQVGKAGTALGQLEKSSKRTEQSIGSLGNAVRSVAGPIAAYLSVRAVIRASDEYGQMASRIKNATSSTEEYEMVQARLLETANGTYRALSEAQEVYLSTADTLRDLGYATSEVLDITDSFSYALVRDAARADQATSAMDAYSKALMKGKVDADAFATILAATPSIVNGISEATGRSTEEIRKLGATGKLSVEALNEGLRRSRDENKALADAMETSVKDALVNLETQFGVFIGKVNESSGASGALVDSIGELADILADPETVAAAQQLAGGIVTAFASIAKGVRETVGVVRWAAEEMAATFHGAASDDIVRLEDQLKTYQDMLANPLRRLRIGGDNQAIKLFDEDEIKANIAATQRQIDEFWKSARTPPPAPVSGGPETVIKESAALVSAVVQDTKAAGPASRGSKRASPRSSISTGSAMIRIYPSKLQGEPLETHHIGSKMTIGAWLRANVPSYSEREVHPISFEVNGALVPSADWDAFVITPDDVVDVTPEPKEPISATVLAIYAAVAVAAIALVVALMPKPQMKSGGGVAQGDALNEASAKGNKVKVNQPIREVAGKRRIYPDYLLPPHRFFSAPRDQWVEMLLCVGKGKFEIPASRILVGDTPLISLGSDAEYTIYQPGQSLAGQSAAEWWHTAEEVGATATGSSGLELTATYAVDPQPSATSYIFSGEVITVPSGAGSFPAGWAPGMIVRIEAPRPYTIVDGGADRDIVQGGLAWMVPFVGMVIEVAGDYTGNFVVHSYTPGVDVPDEMTLNYTDGSPVTALPVGTFSLSVGYAGLRYRLVAASTTAISVERLTDTGGPDTQAWLGFDDFNSADALISLDASTQEGDWTGPFMACPPNEVASHIEWDVMFPGGIVGVDKKGRKFSVSVTVEMQYRDSAVATEWASVRKTYTATQADQLGFTESLALPSMMRPEVRLRRIGAKSDSTQIIDGVEWYGLRAKLQAPAVYEGVTTIAVRVKGGKRLAAQTEQMISAEVTRVLPVRTGEGAWDVESPTRDIVPFVAYVAHSIGYTDDDLDFDELDRLGELWAQRGDHFDMTYESASTVKQIIGHALKAGYADLTIERGRLNA